MERRKVKLHNGETTFTVVARDGLPYEPFEEHLASLRDSGTPYNSIRTVAAGLAAWGTFLDEEKYSWDKPAPQIMSKFIAWLDRGRAPVSIHETEKEEDSSLAPATINNYISSIRGNYYYHLHQGRLVDAKLNRLVYEAAPSGRGLPWAPLAGMKSASTMRGSRRDPLQKKIPKKKPRNLSIQEIDLIISACKNFREKLFWKVLHDTGCRAVAILTRRIEDFNMEKGLVTVVLRKDDPSWAGLKNFNEDVKVLKPETVSLFIEYITSEEKQIDGSDYVFTLIKGVNKGAIWNYDALLRHVSLVCNRIKKKTGKKFHFRPHWFRHTFGTEVQKFFKDPVLTKELMGQKLLQSIEPYQHSDMDDLINTMKEFHERRNEIAGGDYASGNKES